MAAALGVTTIRSIEKGYCWGCNKKFEKISWCAQCKIAQYCGVVCQKNDRKTHKIECIALVEKRKISAEANQLAAIKQNLLTQVEMHKSNYAQLASKTLSELPDLPAREYKRAVREFLEGVDQEEKKVCKLEDVDSGKLCEPRAPIKKELNTIVDGKLTEESKTRCRALIIKMADSFLTNEKALYKYNKRVMESAMRSGQNSQTSLTLLTGLRASKQHLEEISLQIARLKLTDQPCEVTKG